MLTDLQIAIHDYIFDPENPEKCYSLARIYESMGQAAAAVTYFLKCAERTDDKELAYECLIRVAFGFDFSKNRNNTTRGILRQAMMLLPKRPEAYYLLARNFNYNRLYLDAYTYTNLALEFCDLDSKPLRNNVDYAGKYAMIFEKAVAAWWWGRENEARALFRLLSDQYFNEMNQAHKDAVFNNIASIGIGPEKVTHKHYTPEKYSRLRYKFKGAKDIPYSHGQSYQDIFVLSMLDGKKGGTYFEIGSAGPFYGNNTAILEANYEWIGIGVDFNEQFVNDYRKNRKNKILHADALTLDYNSILSELAVNGVIDYLQLDCEPPSITYEIMTKIPFDKFKFAVITYEHDHYADKTKSFRKKSREFLEERGYVLVVNDVSSEGFSSYEDWWVHPDLIRKDILERMLDCDDKVKNIEEYMFPKNALELRPWEITPQPTIEFTTNIAKKGCVVDCLFCPQRVLEKSYTSDTRILTLENFKTIVDKIPRQIRIVFAGFTEPFLNKSCSDMILYAYERGHEIAVFTTGVGMTPEDVLKIKHIPFAGGYNGGFVLHLPDEERIAKHPINKNYIEVIKTFKEHCGDIKNFYTMCMGETVHEAVREYFPESHVPSFWNRAGNLLGEAMLKPELDKVKDRIKNAVVSSDPRTCGCYEDLYHNVVLPNGDVSLCCMDYSLEYILGNLYMQEYYEIAPKNNQCFDICRSCENGVAPK